MSLRYLSLQPSRGLSEKQLTVRNRLLHSFLFFNYFCHKLDRRDSRPRVKRTGLPTGDQEAAALEGGQPTTQLEPPFRYKPYEYYAKQEMDIASVGQRPNEGFVIDKGIEDMEPTAAGSATPAAGQSEGQIWYKIPVLRSMFSRQKPGTNV